MAAVVDTGFENGTDGAALSSPWTISGTPQRAEYDSVRAKSGTLSGWVIGPAAASYAGVGETVSSAMTSNGAEQRFWIYFDTTNQFRVIDDWSAATADRAFSLQFDTAGSINVFTNRTGNPNGYTSNAYTSVGSYSSGWTEFRIVYDFASQTYTLSKRANAGDAWTQLKATTATGYGIPMRGLNTVTSSHGLLFRAYQNTNLWLDDVQYDNAGIVEADTIAPSAPGALIAADAPLDQGGRVDLSWTVSTDNVGVTGYKVYRGTAPGAYGSPVTLPVATTSYADSGLTNGTRYYYAVSAVDAAGNESARSPESSAVPLDNIAPSAPAGLAAVGGTKQVALSWSANSDTDLAGYNVYRNGTKANATLVTGVSYTDTGRSDGTTYTYVVKAVDASGNESPASASASATTSGTSSTFDGTFESGADGVALPSPWAVSGSPQRAEYDSTYAKGGSLSGWIQGPTTAAYAGIGETVSGGLSADGAEQRFWVYFDTTNQFRIIDDWSGLTADRAFSIQFDSTGSINIFTNRAGNPNGYPSNAYTSVGTYSTGWTEFRVVYDFTSQTYQLSKRTSSTGLWTQLKAPGATGYAVPFRGPNAISSSHGTLFRAYQNANMWLDDLRWDNAGIVDPVTTFTITPSAGPGGSISPSGAQTVVAGTSPQFTISPSLGYRIADVRVDGTSVGNVSTYTFANVAADHTIAATFALAPVSGDMPVTQTCDSCHDLPSDHFAVSDPCGECHEMSTYHPGSASELHVPADVTSCTPCHNASLTVEHNGRTPDAGGTFACETCHASTDPLVTAAITANDSSCGACHPGTEQGHAAQHSTVAPPVDCQDAGCHPGADLLVVHDTLTCAQCHSSTNSTVTDAIAAGDKRCATCHPNAETDHVLYHTTAVPAVSCQDAGCHPGTNLLPIHEALPCAQCHESTNATVTNAIAAGDKRCSTCHAGGSNHSAAHESSMTTPDCLECHKKNIADEHDGNCDTCHASTDPDVVAAISAGKVECGSCHAPGVHPPGFFRIRTDYYAWTTTPGPRGTGIAVGQLGANPENPGAHANYLANTAKCGMCHSVHRAAATGGQVKLLPASDASCAGCHTGSTAVTAKLITWTPYSTDWVPEVDASSPLAPVGSPAWLAASADERVAAITNKTAAGGAANQGGPHNDSALDLIADGYWDGTGATPEPSYEIGHRYGCATRRCHLANPHGAGGSKYKPFAAKLLFNASADNDLEGAGTYGGLDAVYDDLGAIDASVQRFVAANPDVIRATSDGNIEIKKSGESAFRAPDANETHSLVAGLTCGRPSNPSTGEDECHAEATYAVVDKTVRELRNKPTEITAGSAYRTDNTGAEAAGYGGNDSRSWKTGHVAGTFAANAEGGSYVAVAGCTGCHDQTDVQNTTLGNFTFPHGQTVTSSTASNLLPNASATPNRARLWMGYAPNAGAPLTSVGSANEKAYDGTCLKCHRDTSNTLGIGLTK